MKIFKSLCIALITSLFTLSSVTISQASSTYTQGWANSGITNIASATSTTTWESTSTGRVNGPSTKMTFIVGAGTQTVRLAISVNAGAYDTSSVAGCAFRDGVTTTLTINTGTSREGTVAFVSKTSTEVICDLTMGPDYSDTGFEIYTGTLGSATQVGYIFVSRSSTGSSSDSSAGSQQASPPPYAGPSIESFDRLPINAGGILTATGKRLDQVRSATINGTAATLSHILLSPTLHALKISVPSGLAPGIYDLEMQTAHGKLTYAAAIVVKAKPVLVSFTLRGSGSQLGSELAEELRMIGSLSSSDYSKIHCVVNKSHPDAAAIAAEICGILQTGSLASANAITSTKSTYKGSGFWVRVYLAG